MDTIESHERRRKQELKRRVTDICDLGYVIAADVNSLFADKAETLMPWDIYPELFSEEKAAIDEWKKEREFEEFKSRRREYAAAHNQQRKRREV